MGVYFTSPDDHIATAKKITTKLIKKSLDGDKRGTDTSALQTVLDELSATQKHLDDLKPEAHPEWEGFGPNEIGYLLREMKTAVAILRGDYALYVHVCIPDSDGKCVRNFEFKKATIKGLHYMALGHYAPTMYAVPAEYAATHTLAEIEEYVDSDDVIWLGDVNHSGNVICGELLGLLIKGS
jgi:hypothetical protein